MKSIRAGKVLPSRVWEVLSDGKGGFVRRQLSASQMVQGSERTQSIDPGGEAVRARQRLGLSQDTFAELLGVSAGTLRGWEQGRRKPNRAARVLLRVAAEHPELVLDAAKRAA
jgi:putative transcriptional regulator